MILQLDIEQLRTLDEVRAFLTGMAHGRQRAGRLPARGAFRCVRLRAAVSGAFALPAAAAFQLGLVRRFLIKVTGFSRSRMTRLIAQYRGPGCIEDRRPKSEASVSPSLHEGGHPSLRFDQHS